MPSLWKWGMMNRNIVGGVMMCLLLTACPDPHGHGVGDSVGTLPVGTLPCVARALAFSTQVSFTAGTDPYAVALGDLNGDGMRDLAVPNFRGSSFSVMLNQTASGAVTPTFATQVQFASGTPGVDDPYAVALGDINADDKLDVAIPNLTTNTVSIFLNQTAIGATTPTLTAQTQFATGNRPTAVALGDVNRDGKIDLAITNSSDNTVSILLNTTSPGATTPTFALQVTFAVEVSPTFVALGDVNGDGSLDLVVTNFVSGTVSVLLNTTAIGATTPTFTTQVAFGTGSGANAVALGDVNGDGKLDMAIANWNSNTASVLLNTTTIGASTPTFASQVTFSTGTTPAGATFGNVDGDCKADLIMANFGDATVSVLLNATASGATTPSFATAVPFSTGGTGSISVALGDVNGDGKLDLAVSNQHGTNASVLLNQ